MLVIIGGIKVWTQVIWLRGQAGERGKGRKQKKEGGGGEERGEEGWATCILQACKYLYLWLRTDLWKGK